LLSLIPDGARPPGQGAAPQAASGQGAAPQAASGQGAAPQAASGQGAAPQAASGQEAAPQAASGQEAAPQAASGQEAAPRPKPPETAKDYMPPWVFEGLDSSVEALKRMGEDYTSQSQHELAFLTWDLVAKGIRDFHGPDHVAANAAESRAARSRLNAGLPPRELELQVSGETVRNLMAFLGPEAPETLYAVETAALIVRATGDTEVASQLLAAVAQHSSESLGPDHPQTLSANDWLARVAAEAAATPGDASQP
jgi:hypothetical protein